MKKNILFACLLLSTFSFGQIIIQPEDSLTAGDSQFYYRADTSTAEFENVIGGNITWDYSGLLMEFGTAPSTNSITPIATSPFQADFPNAQYHEDFPNGIQSFFTNNGNDIDIEGFVFESAGVTYKVVYDDDNLKYITRPVALGNSISDPIEGSAFAPFGATTATAEITGTAVTEADGQGVLILGNNTYNNTIRIKTVETASGPAFIPPSPVALGQIAVERKSYAYYSTSTANNFPLLVIGKVTISLPNNLTINEKIVWTIDDTQQFLSVDENEMAEASFEVFPNPADKTVNITTAEGTEMIQIYNTVGKLITEVQAPKSLESIDVSALSAGVYFVSAEVNGITKTEKLLIK